MPTKTVEDLQNDVTSILTGLDLSDVINLFGDFERAVSTFIQKADVPEASGREPFFLYDGVTDYNPTTTIFGAALVDLRPQGQNREPWDGVVKTYVAQFDRTKSWKTPSGYLVTFEYFNGNPIMRVNSAKAPQRLILDSMSQTNGWATGGSASGLAVDQTVYWQQPGTLRFNLAASGSEGTLSKTIASPNIGLSAYIGVGVAFIPVMMPAAAIGHVTAIKLKIGSDIHNYYEMTQTIPFAFEEAIANFFQLWAFDMSTATTVGVPVAASAGNYFEVLVEYDGTAITNLRMGGLWVSLPSPQEMLFYSTAVFQGANATTPSKTITDATDVIIFGDPAYNIYVREAAREVARSQGGTLGSGVIAQIDQELNGVRGDDMNPGLYAKFRGSNPSEELRTVGNWYYDGSDGGNNYGGKDND